MTMQDAQTTLTFKSSDSERLLRLLRAEPEQPTLLLLVGRNTEAQQTAATEVAKALGKSLYRVDLSRVVSKYIGETEKNLERVFAEAEAAGAVLFFDEADALFGRQSTEKEAADLASAALLKRLAKYCGVSIVIAESSEGARARWRARLIIVT